MSTSNNWLNPYQRSFNNIKAKLISELRLQFPEITDYSEGNIFVIIISIFAAIAEVIHYYIDNMAREAFLPTARRYSSLYKHAYQVDYHIKYEIKKAKRRKETKVRVFFKEKKKQNKKLKRNKG